MICIADDGSGPETKAAVDQFMAENPELVVRHLWHEDRGFRKTVILNKAVVSSDADYLIFTDGDCLLSPGFCARHFELAKVGRFCCGSIIRLSPEATDSVRLDDVVSGLVFKRDWLRQNHAFERITTWLKAMPWPRGVMKILEYLWPVRHHFSGCNASVHRDAALAVNGFDSTMAYGGLDKEFGERLKNSGVRGQTLRFTAPLLHLDHPRGYLDKNTLAENRKKIKQARTQGTKWALDGINEISKHL